MASGPNGGVRNPWVPVSRGQFEIPRPGHGGTRGPGNLTDQEWRLVGAVCLRFFEEGDRPGRLDNRDIARLLGLAGKAETNRQAVYRLMYGYDRPVSRTVKKQVLDPVTLTPVVVSVREAVPDPVTGKQAVVHVAGLIERGWVVAEPGSGDGPAEHRKLSPGPAWRALESPYLTRVTPAEGRYTNVAPPNNCLTGERYTNVAPPNNCQGTEALQPCSAPEVEGRDNGVAPALHPCPGGATPASRPSYSQNSDVQTIDRSIERSSAPGEEEEEGQTPGPDPEALAASIHARLYAGLPPAVAARDWERWGKRYRMTARDLLAGRLTEESLDAALLEARKPSSRVRGKVFFATTNESMLRSVLPAPAPPTPAPVPVSAPAAPPAPPVNAVPPAPPPPPPEPAMDPAAERAEWREWLRRPPDDPLHKLGKRMLSLHPDP